MVVLSVVKRWVARIRVHSLWKLVLENLLVFWMWKLRGLLNWIVQMMSRLRFKHHLWHNRLCLQLMGAVLMTHSLFLYCTLVILSMLAVHSLSVFLYLRSELSGDPRRRSDLREYPFLKLYTLMVLLDSKRIRATTSTYNLRLWADPPTRRPTTTLTFFHIS